MDITPAGQFPAIIIIGELKDRRAVFGNSFDPQYNYTEGQFRSLYMKLQRIMTQPDFQLNKVYTLNNGLPVYITSKEQTSRTILYIIVLREGNFNDHITSIIEVVAGRGGVYTAKRFYSEIQDLNDANLDEIKASNLTYEQAFNHLSKTTVSPSNLEEVNNLLLAISNYDTISGDLIFNQTSQMLSLITEEMDSDEYLDVSFLLADKYYENGDLNHAKELFDKIGELASTHERLALEISSRLRSAKIARDLNIDPTSILDILSHIDDGSLEVATQIDRELFYSLQGYCYKEIGDYQLAEDLHNMCIMISEGETSPSIYVAESHAFLGKMAEQSHQPEVATREYLTASTIASSNGYNQESKVYSHKAALQELNWAEYLTGSAIISKLNNDVANAEYYAWQGLKRLVNSFSHSERTRRKEDLHITSLGIIDKTKSILKKTNPEYAPQTLQELEQHINFLVKGLMPKDQEKEVLKFVSTKISAMLPLPPPIIMLIANDGRLITGGEIGQENWSESILENDDLFSGALSAIMAMLSEVISGDSPLRMLDAGQTQIMIEKSNVCIGALLVDRDLNVIRKALRDTVEFMEREYPDLEDWDGYSLDFSSVRPKVTEIFDEAMRHING